MRHSSDYERPAIFFAGIVVGMFFLGVLFSLQVHGLYAVSRDQGGTFAAITTIAAILIAWRVHIGQMADNIERENLARQRKANSLRARMDTAIINLMRYTERSFVYIQDFTGVAPTPPENAVGLLSDAIETADETTSSSLRQIVSTVQIFSSRMESRQNFQADLERTLLRLHYCLEQMFLYARHDHNQLIIPEMRLLQYQNALNSITRHLDPQYGAIYQAALARLNEFYFQTTPD